MQHSDVREEADAELMPCLMSVSSNSFGKYEINFVGHVYECELHWLEADLQLMLKESVVSLKLLQALSVMRAVCLKGVSFPL